MGELINKRDINKLEKLFEKHITLEKRVQELLYPISDFYCRKCSGECCIEAICRESIKSPFLKALVEKQNVRYDNQYGWLGPSGCRIDYGRPLGCYQFFCDNILNRNGMIITDLQTVIKDFISLGDKAYGNIHLVGVGNLEDISQNKIEKFILRANILIEKAANCHVLVN